MKKTNPTHASFTILTVIFCWLFVSLPVGAAPLSGDGAVIEGVNLDLYAPADAGQLFTSTCHLGPLPVDGIGGPFIGYDPSGNVVFTGQYHEFVGTDPITGNLTFCFDISQDQNTIGLGITDVGLSDVSGFSLNADYLYGGPVGATIPGPIGGVMFPNSLVRSFLFGPFQTSPLLPLDPVGNMAVFDFGFLYPFQYMMPGQTRGYFVINTNAKTYTKGKMYIYSPFGPGGLAQVDAFIPGPALISQKLTTTPQQPDYYSGLAPVHSGTTAKNLVFITHGWNSKAKDPSDWAQVMARRIKSVLEQRGVSSDWDIRVYDWSVDAGSAALCFSVNPALSLEQKFIEAFRSLNAGCPTDALNATFNHGGIELAKALTDNKSYNYIHLIAHSAGSNLIESLAGSIKFLCLKNNISCPFIHSTFLDAYDPTSVGLPYGQENIVDWAEHYVDKSPLVASLPPTNREIARAYNFDVTFLGSHGDPVSAHAWPYKWYLCSIPASGPSVDLDGLVCDPAWTSGHLAQFGFARSLESGSNKVLSNSIDNFGQTRYLKLPSTCLLTSTTICGENAILPPSLLTHTTTPATSFPVIWNTAISATGTVIGTVNFAPLASFLDATPGSPAWITSQIQTAEAHNIIKFDYEFLSQAEDLLSVFFDDQLVYRADQRNTTGGLNHSGDIWIGDTQPGLHTVSFRVDPFGTQKATVRISNLTIGLRSVLTAKAGASQTVYTGRAVTLDGSGSSDSRGVALDYSWLQSSGPAVTLSDLHAVKPTFISPAVSVSGQTLVFQLTTTNSDGASATDSVVITVAKLGDVNVDNSIDTIDLNLVLAARNTPVSGPNDLRDLDGDGMITALDARKLTTLCTRPRCATQ